MASDAPTQAELKECECTDHSGDALKSIAVLACLLGVILVAFLFL